jgi:hypothetical protein
MKFSDKNFKDKRRNDIKELEDEYGSSEVSF